VLVWLECHPSSMLEIVLVKEGQVAACAGCVCVCACVCVCVCESVVL
jgi:hypothetical protein